jgi:dipeptidyl aminopeptidase/acylaminoacyl peptidase
MHLRRSRLPRAAWLTLLFALAISSVAAQAQSSDRLTADLFLDWEFVQSPQISPDGKQVIYTRRWADKVNDAYVSDLWIVNSDGTRNRALTKGSQAQWSPDGARVAYVAPGQPTGAQIFVRWMDTGEETQITRLERAPSNIAWSPDGEKLAFNMTVPATQSFTVKLPAKPTAQSGLTRRALLTALIIARMPSATAPKVSRTSSPLARQVAPRAKSHREISITARPNG